MKLTIEIDDRHTGDLLQFLASLQGKQVEQAEPDPEDPTQRIVPIPAEMHPLPPLPYGYSQWVGRGIGWEEEIPAENRVVRWFRTSFRDWQPTSYFSERETFHIEAIK